MGYQIQQRDIELLFQKEKDVYVKIELLNNNFQTIDYMQGKLIDGSVTIDSNSDIRRQCNLTFTYKNKEHLVSEVNRIWFDKLIRANIGYRHLRSRQIVFYPLGIFLFTTNSFTFDSVTRTVSCQLQDLMANLNGMRNGLVVGALKTTIPLGNDIRTVIVDSVKLVKWLTKYYIEDICKTIPYDIKFSSKVTVYEIIKKLRDLYPCWECFFDIDGTFIYRKIPSKISDIVVLDENIINPLFISENRNNDLTKVKNYTEIYGKDNIHGACMELSKSPTTEEKTRYITELNCENIRYTINPNSPYCVDKIGLIPQQLSGGEFGKIPTLELVLDRAEYENWKSTRMQDIVTLNCIAIPFLEVNQKIQYTSRVTNKTEQYIITKIDIPLLSGTMTMELMKFYPLYPF